MGSPAWICRPLWIKYGLLQVNLVRLPSLDAFLALSWKTVYTVLIECAWVCETILGVMRMISAFLARSVITILTISINPILLSYVILLPNVNRCKYWRNLVYLVVLGSAMGYRFLLLSGTPARYNNY